MDTPALIEQLGLAPHPEGGFYRETWRDPQPIRLSDGRVRSAGTAIYYLLPAATFSAFHRVSSAEVWHRYCGGALLLHVLGAGTLRLEERRPQAVVPAGAWQAAEPESESVLCGCTVSPGFDFADFELGSAAQLAALHPAERSLIARLTRR